MKAEMKAVVASLVVIALALTAVSGITYSWFSDEETADIDVKTGNIELGLSSLDVKVYGSASTVAKYEHIYTSSSGVFTIDLSGAPLADKDRIVVSVPEFTINKDIDVNYYETCNITGPSPSFFTVNGVQTIAKQFKAEDEAKISAHDIIIDFDSRGEGMSQSYKIILTFNAAQAGMPIDAGISTTVSEGGSVLEIPTGTSVSGTAKVEIPGSAAGTTAVATNATSTGYTVGDLTVISGIDLKGTDASGAPIADYLKGTLVTLTFVLDGKYCADGNLLPGVAIYHEDVKFVPSAEESISATYDSVLDRTTITVVTKQGFSPYFVTTDIIKVGDSYYSTLSEAFAKAESGDTITLLADVTSGEDTTEANRESPDYLYVKNDVTLDLNGYDITFLGYGFRVDDGGNLTVVGNGTITAGHYAVPDYENLPFTVRNGGQATINGGTFISQSSAECIFVGGEGSKLVINDGTFMSTKPRDVAKGFLLNVGNGGSVDQIIVNGGVFYNYAPAAGDDVLKGSFLADGKHLSLVIDGEGRSVYTVEEGLEEVTSIDSEISGAVKLTNDVKFGTSSNGVSYSEDLFIDLNGYELTIDSYLFFSGYLIICDSSEGQTGKVRAVNDAYILQTLINAGHFSFCGGNIVGARILAETMASGCTYEFFNGTITGTSTSDGGMIVTQQGNIVVYGGSFIDTNSECKNCFVLNSTGYMIVCGGTFTSQNGATLVGSTATGTIAILGGTFTGDQPSDKYIADGAHINHTEGSNTWIVTLY